MQDKVAIISGASRGLGREIAIALASDGYATAVTYAGSADKAEQVVQSIQDHGGKALAIKADVAAPGQVDALFNQVEQTLGGIDAVINTAGISVLKPLLEFSEAEFSRLMATNLTGTFNILQQAGRRVKPGGRIITFSSNVVDSLPPAYAVYAASKSAVEAMSKVLAKELRGREMTVNILSPGPTATDMFLEGKSAELVETFARQSPFQRLGTPADIIEVVRFLLRPEATWINGQVIKVNGGAN